ncbi:glycosyltransferase family 4 protein [Parasphingorhabdus sp.]|uniref:glycosyltransferase family 4 protein n=1 Tax=Parasphingorhabdus sp. TaxID=2709688 RepID=UPI0032EE05B5
MTEQQIDMVIFDHVQTLGMARIVERLSPRSVRMLNAHNVDHMLYERLAVNSTGDERRALLKRRDVTKMIESSLDRFVHGYWACSDEDHEVLQQLNDGRLFGFTIPNGIATEVLPFDSRVGKREDMQILFCGSLNYDPNRRGLDWFTAGPWRWVKQRLPNARLTIIGYGAKDDDFTELRADPAVDFVGEVDEVTPWYHKTSIAVVPILEGSGTRVKILEAMALGNPVVATTIGAEGIKVTDGADLLLRDEPDQFADAIVNVLTDGELFDRLRMGGRALVDTVYDWRILGQELNATIPKSLDLAGA